MDKDTLLTLLDRFDASGLSELAWRKGEERVVFKKRDQGPGTRDQVSGTQADSVPQHSPGGTAGPHNENPVPGPRSPVPSEGTLPPAPCPLPPQQPGLHTITSPIVATFYGSPSPDAPAFVQAGSRVKKGDTLCVLEAMKAMNHLDAEFDCEVVAVRAKNGDLVEFGQPLFDVRKL